MVLKLKDGESLDHESADSIDITVTTNDGNGGSFDQDFTINVADVNEAVTADDASETTSENVSLNGNVTASDLDGDAISYSLDGQPSEGAVSFNADGSYSFNPGTDFDDLAVGESRTVTFDFTADDGRGSTDGGQVTIEVTGTNDAPTAIDLSPQRMSPRMMRGPWLVPSPPAMWMLLIPIATAYPTPASRLLNNPERWFSSSRMVCLLMKRQLRLWM